MVPLARAKAKMKQKLSDFMIQATLLSKHLISILAHFRKKTNPKICSILGLVGQFDGPKKKKACEKRP